MNWNIYIWLILLGSITGALVYFKKGTPVFLKAFPVYLLTTFIIEFIGGWRSDEGLITVTLYNVFTTIEFVFYFWMLRYMISNRLAKRVLLHSLWLYPVLVILNKLFLQKGPQFHTITVCLGCLLVVMAAIIYFFELFQLNKPVNLIREPSFWICSGLLFFYACTFPLYALINFFQDPSNIIVKNIAFIFAIVNILLYSSFIIASLCRIRIRKSFS
ncbi:hypothetical protein [Agriterribacter sp.]|uniref:hypothetical protein n=1 Tax=Agriterribacter sp. TaxID=2821509 RepID=UPI002B5B913B|nr:hypothetical protein [Agriterribacter sp.]HRP56656.1 hypothetical protein [Agriterribacter sp.]